LLELLEQDLSQGSWQRVAYFRRWPAT
jgi:hypothetical protein